MKRIALSIVGLSLCIGIVNIATAENSATSLNFQCPTVVANQNYPVNSVIKTIYPFGNTYTWVTNIYDSKAVSFKSTFPWTNINFTNVGDFMMFLNCNVPPSNWVPNSAQLMIPGGPSSTCVFGGKRITNCYTDSGNMSFNCVLADC